MNCPFCHKPLCTIPDQVCIKDGLTYWTAEELNSGGGSRYITRLAVEFVSQYPNQDAFFFWDHDKYYTISEMERIARLKAFL
jgi:hypothetical protein